MPCAPLCYSVFRELSKLGIHWIPLTEKHKENCEKLPSLFPCYDQLEYRTRDFTDDQNIPGRKRSGTPWC